jgi:phosphoglycolate phosphatase
VRTVHRAILFDLDGTLLDTLEDIADSTNAALASMGFPVHEVQSFRTLVGDGMETLVRKALPESARDEATRAECQSRLRGEYGRRWAAKTKPYAGIAELLDALEAQGLTLAILSNKPEDFTKLMARQLLGRWRFAAVEGAREGIPKKPDPAAALAIAGRLGSGPASFIYVGDSATDMKTALAAGMRPAGALWGFRPWELEEAGAELLLERPTDLLRHLGMGQ